ncbi:hypothetical protein B0H13DRAFT_1892382 [Mycena leptocephala]|nr:hypothetical protein B0H13DRAFT_1892382 [Mycena leptocephala]
MDGSLPLEVEVCRCNGAGKFVPATGRRSIVWGRGPVSSQTLPSPEHGGVVYSIEISASGGWGGGRAVFALCEEGVDLQRGSDDLFYAMFPDARPSPRSARVAAEHTRIFMPPCTGAAVGRGETQRPACSAQHWVGGQMRGDECAGDGGRAGAKTLKVHIPAFDTIYRQSGTEISKGSVEGDTAVDRVYNNGRTTRTEVIRESAEGDITRKGITRRRECRGRSEAGRTGRQLRRA